jgi:acetylornithine deacetylase/succinyl-diaminopimelate desuccinylase family protein
LQSALELTSSLVSYPTVSPEGNEKECAKYIFDYLKDLRIEDSEIDIHEFDGTRANVVATFSPEKEPGLLLSGHMDVVPAGESWASDPFRATARMDKLFGRGTADMKAGLASMLKSIETTVKGSSLKRRLVFVASAGEETGFVGLAKLVQNSIISSKSTTCVVIGEPTDLQPARAHRGIYRLKVNFVGKSAHAGTPQLGVNAVEHVCKFVDSLESVRADLSKEKNELLGSTTLTPTLINGGIGENVVPPDADVVLDSRRLPIHSSDFIRSKIESRAKDMKIEYHISEIVNHPPLDTPESNFLTKLAEKITGAKSTSCAFGTEGSIYWGELGLPTIIVGPGSVEQAHISNEFVDLSQIDRAVSIYSSFIKEICF